MGRKKKKQQEPTIIDMRVPSAAEVDSLPTRCELICAIVSGLIAKGVDGKALAKAPEIADDLLSKWVVG